MKNISDHVLDIVQNSVEANATVIEIIVAEDNFRDIYSLQINDNGCGMDEETLQKAANPFFTSRTTRKVGLGLPLLKQNALASNGTFKINSELHKGTRVKAEFQLTHIDRPPVGNIGETIYLFLATSPYIRLIYSHHTLAGNYTFNSDELMEVIGEVSLKQADIKTAIIELINNNLEEIKASK